MIPSVLESIPIYYLSLFRMPKGVANLLEKKMRDFLWEGFDGHNSSHLVSWKIVSNSKENGRLGIGNLILKNKALLGKRLWRFSKEKDSLWGRIIVSKYGMQRNGWDPGLASRTTFRCPWKFISRIYPDFLHLTKIQMGTMIS